MGRYGVLARRAGQRFCSRRWRFCDSGENGIIGITVNLYEDANKDNIPDGVAIATATTNSTGVYQFTNVDAGNYIVSVMAPAGYVRSSVGTTNVNLDNQNDGVNTVGSEVRTDGFALTASTNKIDFGLLPDCGCTNSSANLLVNASFENGTTGWSWSSSNGSLTTGTGYVACGSKNGFNNQSSGTSKVWQDVSIAAGSSVTFTAFAGTHTPGINCSPKLSLIFLNASGVVISQQDVTVWPKTRSRTRPSALAISSRPIAAKPLKSSTPTLKAALCWRMLSPISRKNTIRASSLIWQPSPERS